MAKISVIIPAYNCADTIEKTINSILTSGMSDFEIIIVDDGSSDDTAGICDSLSKRHPFIRCVHQKNAGVSAARNRGISEAVGDYIWFFDADDSVKEKSITGADRILSDFSPDMLVFGVEFDYYHKGEIYRRDEMLPPIDGMKRTSECDEMLYDLFVSNSLSSLCTRIIKKSISVQLDTLLREDMFLYEDLEFSLRVLEQCSSIYFIREVIYQYRQSEDGGNVGRRLMRIPHIPDLLATIEDALSGKADKNKILLALYLTLAREKISVSSKEEIETICIDFKSWIDDHDLLSAIRQNDYAMLIYNNRISKLIARRGYLKCRHTAANWVKQNIGDFRKWRFLS